MPVRPAKGCNMNQDERRKYILDQLKIKSSISVSELSEAFSLSEVSVRKLLANMEQEGGVEAYLGRRGEQVRFPAGIFPSGK